MKNIIGNRKDFYGQGSKDSNIFIFFLALIVIFFIVTNIIWLSQDSLPPAWDQAHHMLLSLKYYRLITNVHSFTNLNDFCSVSHYYPPLFHICAVPFIFLFGFSEHNLIMVNFIYLILFAASLYGIGEMLFNKRVGIMAAILCLFYPIMYAMSREYLIDFALVSIVTVVQYLILRSEGGLKKPWNIVLGIAAGGALLIKPAAIIFFLPVWIFILLGSLRRKNDFLPALVSFTISLFIILPWYTLAFKDMVALNKYWQHVAVTIDRDPTKIIPSFLWYKNVLINTLISPNLTKFFLVGLPLFFIFTRKWKSFVILLFWAVPAFIVLVLTPNKDPRYIMPILPVFALLTISGIDAIRKKIFRNILYFLIIITGYVQFNNLSFGVFPSLIKDKNSYYNHVPLKQDWKNKEIIDYLVKNFDNKHIVIGVLPDCQYFNPPEFQLYTYLLGLPYSIEGVGNSFISLERLKGYDIFITKYPKISAEWVAFYRDSFYNEISKIGINNLGFRKLSEFKLPDNSTAVLYQNLHNGK